MIGYAVILGALAGFIIGFAFGPALESWWTARRTGSMADAIKRLRDKGLVILLVASCFVLLASVADAHQHRRHHRSRHHHHARVAVPRGAPSAELPEPACTHHQNGLASWYAPGGYCLGCPHGGTRTASGERFTGGELTAAHRSLPFGTIVKVTLGDGSRSVVVRINDRGPFVHGRIVDLSWAAATKLGMMGVEPVELCW